MIAELRSGESPMLVEHCRFGLYDLLPRMSGGSIGFVRQGSMLSRAGLCCRLRTIAGMDVSKRSVN